MNNLIIFIPTFFFVSITPGMCMTLAMTMGMTIGIRKAYYMMIGELIGVGLVATLSVIGVSAVLLEYPMVFNVFKLIGGGYLAYVGIMLWMSKGSMAVKESSELRQNKSFYQLAFQGFITAIANPKGWAFFVSLLPPFINYEQSLLPQLSILIVLILVLEFICLNIYAYGGKTLNKFLQQKSNVKTMNRIAGCLMIGVAIWLVLG